MYLMRYHAGGERILDIGLSTGPLGLWIPEHAMVVPLSESRIAVFVGCSHPGIDEILNTATTLTNAKEVSLLIGGLHIGSTEAPSVADTIAAFNVRRLIPAHCTSDEAIEYMRSKLGSAGIEVLEPYIGLEVRV